MSKIHIKFSTQTQEKYSKACMPCLIRRYTKLEGSGFQGNKICVIQHKNYVWLIRSIVLRKTRAIYVISCQISWINIHVLSFLVYTHIAFTHMGMWRLKSPSTQLVVQKLVQTNKKSNVSITAWWMVGSSYNGSVKSASSRHHLDNCATLHYLMNMIDGPDNDIIDIMLHIISDHITFTIYTYAWFGTSAYCLML